MKHPESDEKKFFCNHCPKSFIYKDTLKKHIDAIKEKAKYQPKVNINCDYCNETFETTAAVKTHYNFEHPNKPMILSGHTRFNCDQCDAFYFTDIGLKGHCKRVHESDSSINTKRKQLGFVKCDYCSEVFTNSFHIKKHYKNIHPGQPIIANGYEKYECTECPDFYFLKHELEAHLNLEHNLETELKHCKVCRLAYKGTHNCSLKKRQQKKCEQKYPCPQCTREFTASQYLKNHIKSVHENRLDYECEQCKKKFVSKPRLTSHIFQTHSSQVNCGICDKKIANPQQLKRHKVFAHNETEGAIFCVHCPKSVFFNENTYKNHMENKHG